jgi:hypothetical protein
MPKTKIPKDLDLKALDKHLQEQTKSAATTDQVVTSTPPKTPLPKSILAAIEAKKKIEDEARQKAAQYDEDIKRAFEEQVDVCCQTYEALKDSYPNLLAEPRYERFLAILNIKPEHRARSSMAPGGGKGTRTKDVDKKILEYAKSKEEPVTIPELKQQTGASGLTVAKYVKEFCKSGEMQDTGTKSGKAVLYAFVGDKK